MYSIQKLESNFVVVIYSAMKQPMEVIERKKPQS